MRSPVASAVAGWSPSKITPPSLSAVARNVRLFSALDAALARPIVWLQGPPGAGKTTLIAGWLLERRIEPIWQRFDAEDSDPSTLFFYLGMAEARARGAGMARRLPLLTPEYQFGTAAFSRNFFQKLFEGPAPATLVLDDYQELGMSSPVHDLIANGMKEIPQGGHVIVVSRFPPPKEFARLRVNGQMEVIAPELLLLRADEAAAIVHARDARFDAAQLEQALDLTQGWTAGLILMLEALRSGGPAKVEQAPARELLFDYFAGEVLKGLVESERRTLIGLAVMPSMTAAAAERLTGDSDAGAFLERLARRGYFTTRDADEEPHFRFHPLFRQFLLEQARQTFVESENARLKLRAARILEECQQPEAAVPLLREAAAWDELGRLIRAWAGRMEATGRHKVLASWIDLAPPSCVEADGWLLYWLAVARGPIFPEESRRIFRRALAIFSQTGDADGAFLSVSRLVMLITADDLADQAELDELIVVLRQLVVRFPKFSSPFIEAYASFALFAALSRRTGERKEIAAWRGRALAAASIAGDSKLETMLRSIAAIASIVDARFAEAQEDLTALARPETLSGAPIERTVVYFALIVGQVYHQTPGSCVETASLAYREDAAAGIAIYTGLNAAIAAIDCVDAGDLELARTWLRRSAAHMDRVSSRRSGMYHIASALYAFATGNMTEAESAARCGVKNAEEVHHLWYQAISRVALAQLLLLQGKFADAEAQLAAAEAAMDRSASDGMRCRLAMTRAALLLKTGRRKEGLDALRIALAEGERVGARRMALIRPLASPLYSEALAHDMSPEYVRLLIRLESISPPDEADANWPRPLKIVTFGGFHLFKDGAPLLLSRKTPRRLFALLKAIAAFGGKDVAQEKILDAVWPDEDGDSARHSCNVAVHRLRKLLGDPRAIVVKGGKIGFDPSLCWLDVWAFENAIAPRTRKLSSDSLENSLRLYRGDFLAEDEDLPWAAPTRESLRVKYIKAVQTQAAAVVASGDVARAADLYRVGIAASPNAEPLYQGFMRCCETLGRKDEALDAYRRLRAALAALDLAPSPSTTAHFRALSA